MAPTPELAEAATQAAPAATHAIDWTYFAGAIGAALVAMLAKEGDRIRRGEKTNWRDIAWQTPTAGMMVCLGLGIGSWFRLDFWVTAGIIVLLVQFGAPYIRDVVGRIIASRIPEAGPPKEKT